MILPFSFQEGSLVKVTAEIGGVESSLLAWIGMVGSFVDAGPDAVPRPDARQPDAMP